MKQVFSLSFALLFSILGRSYATSVTFSSAGARTVVDAGNTPIANGDLVWIGTFANTSFTFNPTLTIAQNIAAITSAGGWNQFTLDTSTKTLDAGATNTITIGGLAGGGKVTGAATDNNSGATKADFFNGSFIYVWIFNASTTAAATQMGIFQGGANAVPPWVFPTNAGGAGDSLTAVTDSTNAPNLVAIGGAGSVTSTNLKLAAVVPEPSTIATLIGTAGMLGLMRRRRRAVT